MSKEMFDDLQMERAKNRAHHKLLSKRNSQIAELRAQLDEAVGLLREIDDNTCNLDWDDKPEELDRVTDFLNRLDAGEGGE